MRTADIDMLIVPDWRNAGANHWQSRWERHFKTAQRIEQDDWQTPRCADWVEHIVAAVEMAGRPAVLVAHGYGVIAIAHAASKFTWQPAGAFLIAPPDVAAVDDWPARDGGFSPVPMQPLPFPAKLIGSSNDPGCSLDVTQALGRAWGADTSIIADAGHIDEASGHGAWPEGVLSFGMFLKRLS